VSRVAAPDILSRFAAVLLDMNGTVMFGGDRFGPDQDYAATYRTLGGSRLATEIVQTTITACYATMERIYNDPARCDSFPRVLDTLRTLPHAKGLDDAELKHLEGVVAQHERGQVPDAYAAYLRNLARSHPLGLVANILSQKDLWLQEFRRVGVLDLFAVTVFSSDTSSVKPSRKLFDQAMTAFPARPAEMVFVGDSLRCDIAGAAAAGLGTVWIDRAGSGRRAGDPQPDFVVRDLLELVA
jgi:putative hydrolase of the HAD superfamily/5'-nucleotidase